MSVRRALVALTAPLLLLLCACGGGDSVADPPVSSATSSPTQAPHRESPEHFIRRWAAAEKKMENTGETAEYLAMSRGCKACRLLARDVDRYYAAGGSIHWGGWHILTIRSSRITGPTRVLVVNVDSAPTRYKIAAGSPLERLPGGPATHQLTIRTIDGEWQLLVKAQVAT
jgi:hypothetical protein